MRRGPVVLILADVEDPVPWWVASALGSSRGPCPVIVDVSTLSAAHWSVRQRADGRVTSTVALPLALLDEDLAAVWCRGRSLPMPGFATADLRDRHYAAAELRALATGWLHSLGDRVVNRVDADGLTGPSWTPIRWLVEGARAGLSASSVTIATSGRSVDGWRGTPYDARRPVEPVARSGTESVVVVGRHVLGRLASRVGAACLALADRAGCRLLDVSFVREGSDWLMVSADAVPMLRTPLEVQSVAGLLTDLAARHRVSGHA